MHSKWFLNAFLSEQYACSIMEFFFYKQKTPWAIDSCFYRMVINVFLH